MAAELLYYIPPKQNTRRELIDLLREHPEIQFVSLVGIDLAGNDTDEKIPIRWFLQDIDQYFNGMPLLQTDGSSVALNHLASLNDAKVDMIADPEVNWPVDYNWDFLHPQYHKPIGTLRIPSFLLYKNERVCSRAILQKAVNHMKKSVIELLGQYPRIPGMILPPISEISDIHITVGTELEFWVKTPMHKVETDELSSSQIMQVNYWQRTRGSVRTALEEVMMLFEQYGLSPEMGHKEVGGVKARIDSQGKLSHVMEQIEVDWKYAPAMQAADNELRARIAIREIFRRHGLEVIFKAKPLPTVAGNGEHTHIGIQAVTHDGRIINLFSPESYQESYLSPLGYGALMGLLKHYEVINPLISPTCDALNRLRPGFEAPVCVVSSLGHSPVLPSRNRTVLVGVIRDPHCPQSTRFEIRSPNPYTNTYLAVAGVCMAMEDGIRYAIEYQKTPEELLHELSKERGDESPYLETNRQYRSEKDIFDDFTPDERNRRFGKPPMTVYEMMRSFETHTQKTQTLFREEVFSQSWLNGYTQSALSRWKTEILTRILPEALQTVHECEPLFDRYSTELDSIRYAEIDQLRQELAKDTQERQSLFTQMRTALHRDTYDIASRLELLIAEKMSALKDCYAVYRRNILIQSSSVFNGGR